MKSERSDPINLEELCSAIDRLIPDIGETVAVLDEGLVQEPFDKKAFLDRMLGDTELAREVAGLFLSHSQELMAAIKQALAGKDPKSLADAAQSLKGSVGSLGVERTLARVRELETLAHAKDLRRAAAVFDDLEREMGDLARQLASIWGKKELWKILIADDDPVSRKVLQANLVKWGHDPIVCVDGSQALLALNRPDGPKIAILDWMMPGLDGVQVCREVRKKKDAHYIYIILLTGKDRTDEIIEGLDAGADDYLIKPFKPDELKNRIREGFRLLNFHANFVPEDETEKVEVTRDPATGLLTRNSILVALKRHIGLAEKHKESLGVMLVQISDFRQTRERGGIPVESTLREFAGALQSSIGSPDLVGRFGDGKILLLLPGSEKDQVMKTAQALVALKGTVGATVVSGLHRIPVESVILAVESALQDAMSQHGGRVAFATLKPRVPSGPPTRPRSSSPTSKLDLELFVAARVGNLKRAKGLIESGANVNTRDNKGNTPLIEAAFFKYPDLVELLLQKGADVTIANSSGDTALTEAVRAGHTQVVKALLPRLTARELQEGSSALYRALYEASSFGNTEVVGTVKSYLSRYGAPDQ